MPDKCSEAKAEY